MILPYFPAFPAAMGARRDMSWTGQAALSADPGKLPVSGPGGLRLRRWNDRAVAGVAVAAFASGFGQFGVVAALGDVARGFGQVNHGATLADQAGLLQEEVELLTLVRSASISTANKNKAIQ